MVHLDLFVMAEGGGGGVLPPIPEQPEQEGVQQLAVDQPEGVQQHVDNQAEGAQPVVGQPGEGHQGHQDEAGQPEVVQQPAVEHPVPSSESTPGAGAVGENLTEPPETGNIETTEEDETAKKTGAKKNEEKI